MRSIRNDALRRAPHLVQLRHQAILGVQTSCCIDNQHVIAAPLCRLQRIEERRRRITTLTCLDDLNATPLSPNLKLLNRSRAKGIRRAHQYALGLSAEQSSQLSAR